MRIRECVTATIIDEEMEYKYFYRLTEVNFKDGQAYGVEIERQDMLNGSLVSIERDSIEVISNVEEKVRELFYMLYDNTVSPIHLVDILGEYCDEYVADFQVEEKVLVTV